jgi:hypothetical protein
MNYRIPNKLHIVFNEYITDEEIGEWLNDAGDYNTWDIDYDTMVLSITGDTEPLDIKQFWEDVFTFYEEYLETTE